MSNISSSISSSFLRIWLEKSLIAFLSHYIFLSISLWNLSPFLSVYWLPFCLKVHKLARAPSISFCSPMLPSHSKGHLKAFTQTDLFIPEDFLASTAPMKFWRTRNPSLAGNIFLRTEEFRSSAATTRFTMIAKLVEVTDVLNIMFCFIRCLWLK